MTEEGGSNILPVKKQLTEMEKHKGWIENLRNEQRTMKE